MEQRITITQEAQTTTVQAEQARSSSEKRVRIRRPKAQVTQTSAPVDEGPSREEAALQQEIQASPQPVPSPTLPIERI
ncbi:hypothetical protein KSD_59510 [Ktedonobacter sp. SOSP1-85]|uniref:hypothetical protein n=1 Tax=Ktedonobacter sp. SOSP1-85 TaxID=2778367 RepID=UPI0019157CC3|nr:hypothetical protein [Ktedonobacter sp. SOSP1-85]GHO78180.1 hypothetical protein KSD_59510 [Ktedonobacter sp. SOSP1-85]